MVTRPKRAPTPARTPAKAARVRRPAARKPEHGPQRTPAEAPTQAHAQAPGRLRWFAAGFGTCLLLGAALLVLLGRGDQRRQAAGLPLDTGTGPAAEGSGTAVGGGAIGQQGMPGAEAAQQQAQAGGTGAAAGLPASGGGRDGRAPGSGTGEAAVQAAANGDRRAAPEGAETALAQGGAAEGTPGQPGGKAKKRRHAGIGHLAMAVARDIESLGPRAAPVLVDGVPVYIDPVVQENEHRVEHYEVAKQVVQSALTVDRAYKIYPPITVRNAPSEKLWFTVYDQYFKPVFEASLAASASATTEVVWKGEDTAGRAVASGLYTARLESSQETIVREVLLR